MPDKSKNEASPAKGRAAFEDAPSDSGEVLLRLEDFLPYRLNVLTAMVSQALSPVYQERYGFGVPEWRVLVTLGQCGMMTGTEIGQHCHMHKAKVSRATGELEARKLVARRRNRDDLRESQFVLTQSGRAIYRDLAPGALAFSKQLVQAIAPADRDAFDRAIDSMTDFARNRAVPFARRKLVE
jgi:DNA-binding MarR family transcriptional regulator